MNLLTVVATVAFFAGAGVAYNMTSNHYQAAQAKQDRAAAEAYQARTVELNQAAANLERAKHERKIVYRTIEKQVDNVVTRDVYRSECFDNSGLSIANAALAGRASTGEPDAAVSATGAAAGNDGR